MNENISQKVAILGASNKPDRFSFRALRMLKEHGHTPIPVHPSLEAVEGVPVVKKLSDLPPGSIDTLTLYVNPKILETYVEQILTLKPRRIIFNPGTENSVLREKFDSEGIQTVEGCTLIMLGANQF